MDYSTSDAAKRYKPAEAMTGPFALHLIKQSALDKADGTQDLAVFDNACGTGVLTSEVYETLSPAAQKRLNIVCGDFSAEMVRSVQERIEQSGWTGATAKVVDAQNMDLPSDHFTHVLTNFAIFLLPNPRACITESLRILRPQGIIGLTSWKSVGWYPLFIAAASTIPGVPRLPTFAEIIEPKIPQDKGWVEPADLEQRIRDVGFVDVKWALYKNTTKHAGGEAYVQTFALMSLNVMRNVWSEEEAAKVAPYINEALLKEVKSRYGEGEVTLEWEAWCITAKKP